MRHTEITLKIRSNFVSNSSSSSFIAGYGVVPEHKMKDFEETMIAEERIKEASNNINKFME